MTSLEKAVLATLSYYDIFDYPLTGFEIWQYLVAAENIEGEKFEIGELFTTLDESESLKNKISQRSGFYHFFGREEIVEKRLRRKKLADEKWKKMNRIFRMLAIVPFVRGIFVSGSLAVENSKEDSDVDVIVVAKYGRIWTVRTFMTIATYILRARRHGEKTRNRICLNHYITDKSLCIPFQSLYTAQLYVHVVNLYREDRKIFEDFQRENDWIRKYVRNYGFSELESVRTIRKNKLLFYFSRAMESILSGTSGNYVENIFSRVESERIKKDLLYSKSGGRVTIDDTQLEFHPDSHECFIIPQFNRKVESLGALEFAGQKDTGLNR